MTKKDLKILSYLKPYNNGILPDVYFVNSYFKGKEDIMHSRLEKVSEWVTKNEGKIIKLSEKRIIRERKGFLVRIIFPCFGKRDMKNIMTTLF